MIQHIQGGCCVCLFTYIAKFIALLHKSDCKTDTQFYSSVSLSKSMFVLTGMSPNYP